MATTRGQLQVQFLRSVLSSGGRILESHFSIQRGLAGRSEAMYLLTLEQQGVRSLQELSWSSQLEQYLLVELKLKVASSDEEAERFAMILLNNFSSAEAAADASKDYVQAVLVDVLREYPEYQLEDVLDRISTPQPSTGSQRYQPSAALIRRSIDGMQMSAHLDLGYSLDQALDLMQKALRIVLDETFHLAAMEQLFPRRS